MQAFMPLGLRWIVFFPAHWQLLAFFIHRDGRSSRCRVSGRTFLIYTPPSFATDCSASSCPSVSSQRWRKPSVLLLDPIHWLTMPGLGWETFPSAASISLRRRFLFSSSAFDRVSLSLGLPHQDAHRGWRMRDLCQDPEQPPRLG